MNKTFLVGSAVMAMFAVTACSSQNEDLTVAEVETASIQAAIANNGSRSNATDQGVFTWEKGDKIYTLADGVVYTNKSSESSAVATFTTTATDVTGSQYAVYPYNADAPATLNDNKLTFTLPSEYEYTVEDDNTIIANTNAPMFGTLTDGVYQFQHLAGALRLAIPTLPATAKTIKFVANTRIAGEFTADLSAEKPQLAQDEAASTTNNTVTISLSSALTSAVNNARVIIPLPVGEYAGFKVYVYDSSDNVLSAYTTLKTYNLGLQDLALYSLSTQGANVAELSANTTSCSKGTASPWSFDGGWTITNSKSKTYGAGSGITKECIKYARNVEFTITIPDGKKVTKVSFSGYVNKANGTYTGYIYQIGSTTFGETKEFNGTDVTTASVSTIALKEPATGSLAFQFKGDTEGCLKIYLTYEDAE
jgi:hypothetical protein